MDNPTKIGIGSTAFGTVLFFVQLIWPHIPQDVTAPGLIISIGVAIWGFSPLAQRTVVQAAASFKPLTYLHHRDETLGPAIDAMARKSAWGRWYSAQWLINSGKPIQEENLLNTAARVVLDKIRDGELVVRGRPPGEIDYQEIQREHWRSSFLHFIPDRVTLWRLEVLPVGGVEISPDGEWRADDHEAELRNSAIRRFDSLIVDARQFEFLWPKKEPNTDKVTRQFLKDARQRHLDADTIRALSRNP